LTLACKIRRIKMGLYIERVIYRPLYFLKAARMAILSFRQTDSPVSSPRSSVTSSSLQAPRSLTPQQLRILQKLIDRLGRLPRGRIAVALAIGDSVLRTLGA
jgi:hypothetical protein